MAVHNDELWITMRIPIVNLAEQMVRAVPLSNQIWIMENMVRLGIPSSLFKNKNHDTYTVLTNSNFESCNRLDIVRVCNVRKTKFRPANPFIAPIDIGHDRILLISNVSTPNFSVPISSAKSICNNEIKTETVHAATILRIPLNCSFVGKAFEINKDHTEIQITETERLEKVFRPLVKPVRNKFNLFHPNFTAKLISHNEEFMNNIEKEKKNLKEIDFNFTHTEIGLMVSSGFLSTFIFLIAIVWIWLKCARACKIENIECEELSRNILDESNCPRIEKNVDCANNSGMSENLAANMNDESDKKNDIDRTRPPFQQKR